VGNKGFFDLGLLDVRGQIAHDESTDVRFLRGRDRHVVLEAPGLEFPPRHLFELPAFPQASNLLCEVTPSRFRHRETGFFTLTDRERVSRSLTILRLPEKWNARFERWKDLPSEFAALKNLLGNSPDLKVIGGKALGTFSDGAYDDVDDYRTILAKASLLNLYAKLSRLEEPTGSNRSWFSFVVRLLEIGRERLIALADPALAPVVERVRQNLGQFSGYRAAEDPEGHRRNVPEPMQSRIRRIISIKSREDQANLQLSVFTTDDPSLVIVDADIDENGELLAHLADVFKHWFTGGTHPFDIHEYLALTDQDLRLGYELV
jgi:hypothetical protein